MMTLNEQIKKEYGQLSEKKSRFDSEREREEMLDSQAAWMRVAVKRKRGLSQREEMSINI